MDSHCRPKILLVTFFIGAFCSPGSRCSDVRIKPPSKEEVLLLKDEPDPKCFTRTREDFTCFFETADNKTYDLLYTFNPMLHRPTERCQMSVQRTDEGAFLHICSFPDRDVMLFVDIDLQVVERSTNTRLHARTLGVEDHLLLDPPSDVSLHPNGRVGQLQVLWRTKVPKHLERNLKRRIRYSFGTRETKIKEAKDDHTLDSLAAGEEVEVQVAIKPASNGHWSSWSPPARAFVPQSADDISTQCFTSDLHHVTCRWNGSRYGPEDDFKLFYSTSFRGAPSWTDWAECPPEGNVSHLCRFDEDVTKIVKVKLAGAPAPLGRVFYGGEFTLNNSIKTSPPAHLTGTLKENKLFLNWEAPLASLLPHLEYEVDYQVGGGGRGRGGGWKMTSGPQAEACVEVPAGSRYSVRVRAKPAGSFYSGHWSDWSPVLSGDAPSDIGIWLTLCIPLSLLITAIILITLFFTYHRKLKQYFWPPVPSLDKVLQGFLTEINRQTWDPPATAKQCPEETASSVVEVMSEDKVAKRLEESTELLSAAGRFSGAERPGGSVRTEVSPDYVTLNKDSGVLCPQGNTYVFEQVGEGGGPAEGGQLADDPPGFATDFLNRSYLLPAEPADGRSGEVTAGGGAGKPLRQLYHQ